MPSRTLLMFGGVVALVVGLPGASPAAEPPTAAELIALVREVGSDEPGCRAIDLSGWFRAERQDVRLDFRVQFRAPDTHTILLADGADGTPLFVCAGGRMLTYDPTLSVGLYSKASLLSCSGQVQDQNFVLAIGVSAGDGSARSRVRLDLPALLAGAEDADVVRIGPSTYRLTHVHEKGRIVAHFDTTRPCPLIGFAFFGPEATEPALVLDRIAVGADAREPLLQLPTREQLAEAIDVLDTYGGFAEATARDAFGVGFRACLARVAIHDPSLRPAVEALSFTKLDWEAIRRNDRQFRAAFRRWMPGDRPR